jgi:hypothetical protein
MKRQYRQGDVLLCAVDNILPGATLAPRDGGRVVVAEGELTGHAHAFVAARVRMFREEASRRSVLIIGKGGARLCHEEHDPILVPEGHYELRRQREYTPQAPRLVRD